jgi:hypothetical protein
MEEKTMNQLIEKFIAESTICQGHPQIDGTYFDKEKFAELIVRECCEVLEQTEDALDRQKWPTPRGCVEYIKDHFGVES